MVKIATTSVQMCSIHDGCQFSACVSRIVSGWKWRSFTIVRVMRADNGYEWGR